MMLFELNDGKINFKEPDRRSNETKKKEIIQANKQIRNAYFKQNDYFEY